MSLSSASDSSAADSRVRRWAVIGGGISGLVAAWQLKQLRPQDGVELYEASPRLGGILGTSRVGEWLIEQAADMFVTQPSDAVSLCRDLKIEDQLLATNADKRGAMVAFRGKLHRIPEGFSLMAPSAIWPIATSGLLSLAGKLRLLRERFVPARRMNDDESFESFAIRRCGMQAYERLVQPLVSGIYTADPQKLSMQATSLNRFVEMERRWGSMTRGVIREALERRQHSGSAKQDRSSQATGARYGMFVAPGGGMQVIIDRLASEIGEGVKLGVPVSQLQRLEAPQGKRWRLNTAQGSCDYDGVIVAANIRSGAKLMESVDSELASELGAIEHASCAVVCLGMMPRKTPPKVFGILVPNVERRPLIAAALTSHKFPGRAPAGGLLLRLFFGGALNPQIMLRSDEELIELAQSQLREVAGIEGPVEVSRVVRWTHAMPQYHVGHLQRVEKIEQRAAALPGFELIGNAFRGVGIPDCVRMGRAAAERLIRSVEQV